MELMVQKLSFFNYLEIKYFDFNCPNKISWSQVVFISNLSEEEKLLALYNWALNFLTKQYIDFYGFPCPFCCCSYNENFKAGIHDPVGDALLPERQY